MGPFQARGHELRREQVVRAQRDEPVRLDPPAALQHLLHRRLQVVKADLREHPAEPLERLHVQLQERLLGLHQRRLTERRPGERRAHHEQMRLHRHPAEHHERLAPVDLRLHPRRVDLRDEHLPDRKPHRPLARADVLTNRRLRDISTVLIHQAPVDPPRGMPLLARRSPIRLKPPVDHRPIRTELRRRPAHRRPLRRRHRRRQRLLHRPAMNPMPDRQPADREALPITIPSDLLELLHPGTHSLWRLPLELDEPPTVSRPSDTRWGQFKPSQWGHFRASLPERRAPRQTRAPGTSRLRRSLGSTRKR